MFGFKRTIQPVGILNINRRNVDFILNNNAREDYPFADDKLLTKQLFKSNGIPVPELFGTITVHSELRYLEERFEPLDSFVVKPSRGAGGKGILLVSRRNENGWIDMSGKLLSLLEMRQHISNIISGLFSLAAQPDVAMIEERIESHQFLRMTLGAPDIRIIVYKGVPLMAMLRLPTKESSGRANLHRGAVGVGIDIAKGETTFAVHNDRTVDFHPDTGERLSGTTIPYWEELLVIGARSYELIKLGYQGIDIAIHKDKGPLVLEVNTRPGLNIQIANREGLLLYLGEVDKLNLEGKSVEERVLLGKEILQKVKSRSKTCSKDLEHILA